MVNEAKCKQCGKRISVAKNLLDVLGNHEQDLVSDFSACALMPTICSDVCLEKYRQMRREEAGRNYFERILNLMPEVYKGVKMSDFDSVQMRHCHSGAFLAASQLVKRFCRGSYWSLTLQSSQNGVGKTRLGLYILACLALKGIYRTSDLGNIQDAGYYSAADICKILRTESFDSKQFNLRNFYRSRVLMIDDLGMEKRQESNELANILKVREENNRRTILTSNLTESAMVERYSKRIVSRIEKGIFIMQGEDRRTLK